MMFRGEIAQQRGEDEIALQLLRRSVPPHRESRACTQYWPTFTQQENSAAAIPEMDLALALDPWMPT